MTLAQRTCSVLLLVSLTVLPVAYLQPVFAGTMTSKDIEKTDPASVYQSRYVLQAPATVGNVPEVVEVQLPAAFASDLYLVDGTNGLHQPYAIRQETSKNEVGFSVSVDGQRRPQLTDKLSATGVDLVRTTQDRGEQFAELEITLATQTAVNGLQLSLDPLSSPPRSVTIEGAKKTDKDAPQIVFVNQMAYQPILKFPTQTVDTLRVTFAYNQTLRLTEVDLVQPTDPTSSRTALMRFLAKSNENYILYVQPDMQGRAGKPNLESGALFSRTTVQKLSLPKLEPNPFYKPADGDSDGLVDALDNCPKFYNPDQLDNNLNGVGEACEDFDVDGVLNAQDNCAEQANAAQLDVDGDGIGDVCDKAESRFTEQNPWLPWAAMAGTAIIIAGLFYSVLRSKKLETVEVSPTPTKPQKK
jgi:hypothetical protein